MLANLVIQSTQYRLEFGKYSDYAKLVGLMGHVFTSEFLIVWLIRSMYQRNEICVCFDHAYSA